MSKTEIITTREAAKLLGVNESRIRQMIGAGTIRTIRFGWAHGILRSDILELLAERRKASLSDPRIKVEQESRR
jgi:excisionase family DNA binding protein